MSPAAHLGLLREWITIQTPTATTDTLGGQAVTWATLAMVPAEYVPLRVSERLQAAALQTEAAIRFRVRARADLRTTMRVLWTPTWPPGLAQKTMEISGITPVGDGRVWFWIDCLERPTS